MANFSSSITLGLIQMASSNSPTQNLSKAQDRIIEATKSGAQIVALPELFLTRYFCQTHDRRSLELAEPVPGPTVEALQPLARDKEIVLIVPLFEREETTFYNTAAVLDADGRYLGKYRKLHIPNDIKHYYGESSYFSPGDLGCPVFQTRFGKLGVMICWDQWFPESARQMALAGAQLLIYPTAIGHQVARHQEELNKTEREAWQVIQRSHAIANGLFVAAVNRVGRDDHLDFWGTSFVSDPLGRVLAQASDRKEESLLVSCDLGQIEAVRADWPFHHALRKDVY